jgi:hypothetical protein
MNATQRIFCVGACLQIVLGFPETGLGQGWSGAGGPLTGPPVRNAPFSADATTTVRQTLGDGTRIQRVATARYYRDLDGRVRVEQSIVGLEELDPGAASRVRTTVWPNPDDWGAYVLDPLTRIARKGPRDIAGRAVGGGDTFALPLGGVRFLLFHGARHTPHGSASDVAEESLGTRRIAGVDAVGRRFTRVFPVGQLGNDRPIQVTEERWESPELKIVVFSRLLDPRVGVIEYQLSNVRRANPPPSLFVVPSDYMVGSSNEKWITLEWAHGPHGASEKGKRQK